MLKCIFCFFMNSFIKNTIFLLIFFHPSIANSSLFENTFNHYSGSKLKRFKVCGERCSGTTFLSHLIQENFPDLSEVEMLEYGQKHFLWWLHIPLDADKLKNLQYSSKAVDFSDADDCLFIVIVRSL